MPNRSWYSCCCQTGAGIHNDAKQELVFMLLQNRSWYSCCRTGAGIHAAAEQELVSILLLNKR
jgi:hypothetical protein